ncbi:hypothetical protein TSA6c_16890 [Azospirillum sp. TSA6c]|nr:hypothetical protein TSA6c_16890 [Azospirillum sp. TSA6c]
MGLAYEANMTRIGTFVAGEDMTDHQYKAVILSTTADDTAVKPTGQGVRCIGILQNAPKAGQQCDICIAGISPVIGGASVTRGSTVTVNAADGEVGPASSGDYVLGILTQSITDGAKQSMLVQPQLVPLA